MRHRAAAWLAWSLAGLCVAMFVASAALASATLLIADGPPSGLVGMLALFLPLLPSPSSEAWSRPGAPRTL